MSSWAYSACRSLGRCCCDGGRHARVARPALPNRRGSQLPRPLLSDSLLGSDSHQTRHTILKLTRRQPYMGYALPSTSQLPERDMPVILRHFTWGLMAASLTGAILIVGWLQNPWCWGLPDDAKIVLELVGAIFLAIGFATGFECSRIEAESEESCSEREAILDTPDAPQPRVTATPTGRLPLPQMASHRSFQNSGRRLRVRAPLHGQFLQRTR